MAHTSVRKKNILITGKTSRFCNYLKNDLDGFNTYFTTKKNFNILNFKQMQKFLKIKIFTIFCILLVYPGPWIFMIKL